MHLDTQKGVYYAQLRVPKDAQEVIGKTAFRKTLQTRDKLEAQRRAIPLVQQWKAEIGVARLPPADRLNSQLSALRTSLRGSGEGTHKTLTSKGAAKPSLRICGLQPRASYKKTFWQATKRRMLKSYQTVN